MTYQITASRRRPKNFKTMIGQEFVSIAISHSLESQTIAHAYLFTGPRGVGKTSSARILAACLNCLNNEKPSINPCGTCSNCVEIATGSNVDVIEIDGASNTGVADVRNIKDEILFPPNGSRFKIYIIDEVHMLSNGAFNALLKTIEEPPVYVKFIFATTESHKIPATIKSRCQQFNFKLISIELIKNQLEIALEELKINYDKESIFWIAKEAKGSMRDAYTLLDQAIAISEGNITLTILKDKIGFIGIEDLNNLVYLTINQNLEEAITFLHNFFHKGVSAEQIIQDLSEYFHALLLIKYNITNESLLGYPLSSFWPKIINKIEISHTKELLNNLFQLYKSAKLSLNLSMEIEFFLFTLASIHLKVTPEFLLNEIVNLKNSMLNINLEKKAISQNSSKNTSSESLEKKISIYIYNTYGISILCENILLNKQYCTIRTTEYKHYQILIEKNIEIKKILFDNTSSNSWQINILYDKIDLINNIFNGEHDT